MSELEQDKIHILSPIIANQIAAGEVVQRPASIVKELMENSVDAGASSIHVEIAEGGLNLIQVVDDGMGMSERDAKNAFLRHATSKISKAEDLFALHTFGFRGEALASIAAVAQVELRTRRAQDSLATQVVIGGASEVQTTKVAGAKGTNIVVRNLFFNIPARRKFLKSVAYETRLVVNEFERIVLVNPDISFSLRTSPDKAPLQLTGGNLHQRISSIMAKGMGNKLLPLDVDTPVVRLSGYIGTQAAAKKGVSEQFFFVNGRYMRNAYMQKAVVRGYGKLIAADALPTFFIYIEVDPSRIDVNIHPTKSEIKFLDEQVVWQVIHSAVRQTLGKHNVVPTLDFTDTTNFDIPVYNNPHAGGTAGGGVSRGSSSSSSSGGVRVPGMGSGRTNYNPFTSYDTDPWEKSPLPASVVGAWGGDVERAPFTEMIPPSLVGGGSDFDEEDAVVNADNDDVQREGDGVEFYEVEAMGEECSQQSLPMDVETAVGGVLVFGSRYLATVTVDGLVVIDYPRALSRIMYEQVVERFSGASGAVPVQRLLQPQTVSLTHGDHILVIDHLEQLQRLGYEVGDMGGTDVAVYGVPAVVVGVADAAANSDVGVALQELIAEIKEQGQDLQTLQGERLAITVARGYARGVCGGSGSSGLSVAQAQTIVQQLMVCQEPSYTADSLPIIEVITLEELTKRFKK